MARPRAARRGADDSENPRAIAGDNKRKAAIEKAHAEIYKLTKQEEALMDLHIAPIRDKKAKIKAKLKKDHSIEAKPFNARQTVYYYEREAEEGGDWITLSIIREQWDATPVGGGIDLVTLAERATEQQAKELAAKSKVKDKEAELA